MKLLCIDPYLDFKLGVWYTLAEMFLNVTVNDRVAFVEEKAGYTVFDKAVDFYVSDINETLQLSKDSDERADVTEFLNTPFAQLIKYHHSLGRAIRNEFKLWTYDWLPEIYDLADESPYHPDAISFVIIQTVWLRANKERQSA